MSCLSRCPDFWGVPNKGFHCCCEQSSILRGVGGGFFPKPNVPLPHQILSCACALRMLVGCACVPKLYDNNHRLIFSLALLTNCIHMYYIHVYKVTDCCIYMYMYTCIVCTIMYKCSLGERERGHLVVQPARFFYITQYGSTVYIGIAMVFVFSPYIREIQFLLSVSSQFDF